MEFTDRGIVGRSKISLRNKLLRGKEKYRLPGRRSKGKEKGI